jgi:hypothetical protein
VEAAAWSALDWKTYSAAGSVLVVRRRATAGWKCFPLVPQGFSGILVWKGAWMLGFSFQIKWDVHFMRLVRAKWLKNRARCSESLRGTSLNRSECANLPAQ